MADMTSMEDAFKSVDADNDGKISSADLKTAMEKAGAKVTDDDIAAIMSVADADGTGSVTYEEFSACIEGHEFLKVKISLTLGMLFEALDTDGTGEITKANVDTICQQAGVTDATSQEQIDEVFNSMDADGTGSVTYEEFVEGILGTLPA